MLIGSNAMQCNLNIWTFEPMVKHKIKCRGCPRQMNFILIKIQMSSKGSKQKDTICFLHNFTYPFSILTLFLKFHFYITQPILVFFQSLEKLWKVISVLSWEQWVLSRLKLFHYFSIFHYNTFFIISTTNGVT